jgi:hypothetical protein
MNIPSPRTSEAISIADGPPEGAPSSRSTGAANPDQLFMGTENPFPTNSVTAPAPTAMFQRPR